MDQPKNTRGENHEMPELTAMVKADAKARARTRKPNPRKGVRTHVLNGKNGGKSSGQQIQLAKRRALAMQLRIQGGSYREIATTLAGTMEVDENNAETGLMIAPPRYSGKQAYTDVMHELKAIYAYSMELAREYQTLTLLHLGELWQTYYPKAIAGDYAAFDRVMRLIQERNRTLTGADTLSQVNIDVNIDVKTLSNEELEILAQGLPLPPALAGPSRYAAGAAYVE